MFTTKLFALFAVMAMAVAFTDADTGTANDLDLPTAESLLKDTLVKLSNGEGPNYKVGKVYGGTKQTVAGVLYKIDADISESDGQIKRCIVEIWSRPWLPNATQVTFKCPGEKDLEKTV